MKTITRIILVAIGCLMIASIECTHQNGSASALINQYKDAKNPFGVHSLFTGHNAENVSNYFRGVPPPVQDK